MKEVETTIEEMFQEDDVVVLLRPTKDADGKWTGEVSIALASFFDDDSALNKTQRNQLLMHGAMTASAFPVMMNDDYIYDELHEYAMSIQGNEEFEDDADDYAAAQEDEKEAVKVKKNGNIYTLSFTSKTEGNA